MSNGFLLWVPWFIVVSIVAVPWYRIVSKAGFPMGTCVAATALITIPFANVLVVFWLAFFKMAS